MTSSADNYADLVQIAPSSYGIQEVIEDLARYFNVESIEEKEGVSKVNCEYDETKALEEVRKEFKQDLHRDKKITDSVKAIVPRPEKKYYLHCGVRLLVFQNGWSNLVDLVPKDDAIILIPVTIVGTSEIILLQQMSGRQTAFRIEKKFALVISGDCSLYIPPANKVVCVVLCVGKDKE